MRNTVRPRGGALAATLGVIAIVVVSSFTLFAVCFSHLGFANRWQATQRARNAADSAVSLAFARIIANVELGKSRSPADDIEVTTADGAQARITFSQDSARQDKIPWSTNNLAVTVGTPGWNRTVPKNAIHLVASSTVDGATATVEAVMHIPPFPYAIASSGLVKSDNGLVVAKVSGAVDARTFDQIPRERLLPAHIVSNSRLREALTLGPESRVTGDVQASGGIRLSQDSLVLGQVRPNADPVVIPHLDIDQELGELMGRPGVQTLASAGPTEAVTGVAKCEGSMSTSGDLVLDQGLVYVQGDLAVRGGIVGKGAVYVTGKTSISGASDLAASSMTALYSKGDVVINGGGKGESSYRGLIYTEGSFTARDITLMGAFVANRPAPQGPSQGETHLTGGEMTYSNVNVIQDDAATAIKVVIPPPPFVPKPIDLMYDWQFKADGSLFSDMSWPGVDPVPDGVHVYMHIGGTPPNFRVTFMSALSGGTPTSAEMNVDEAIDATQSIVQSKLGTIDPAKWQQVVRTMHDFFQYTGPPHPPPGSTGPSGDQVLDLDFNRFLSPGDSLRLALWHVL